MFTSLKGWRIKYDEGAFKFNNTSEAPAVIHWWPERPQNYRVVVE